MVGRYCDQVGWASTSYEMCYPRVIGVLPIPRSSHIIGPMCIMIDISTHFDKAKTIVSRENVFERSIIIIITILLIMKNLGQKSLHSSHPLSSRPLSP